MSEESPTVRELIIAKLQAEFGQPVLVGHGCRWSIRHEPKTLRPPINISIEDNSSSEATTIWVFDPRKSQAEAAQPIKVADLSEVDQVVAEIKYQIAVG